MPLVVIAGALASAKAATPPDTRAALPVTSTSPPTQSEPKPKGAGMHFGVTRVTGPLPPEVVRRILRQNYGRFRKCFEEGVSRNPKLEGYVAVRFQIEKDGSVSGVTNAGSVLPDEKVVQCIVQPHATLSFPRPPEVVTVQYSISFQPAR